MAADYSASSGSVTFPAGSAAGATQTFTVQMTDDMLSETAENFTVELGTVTSSISAHVWPRAGSLISDVLIAESDPITVTLSGPSTVDEGDVTTVYTVSLSPSGVTPTLDLTVDYSATDGTAEAGEDYDSPSDTLTFTQTAPGSQTFTVETTEDTVDESDETFAVSISSPSGGGGPAPSLGTSKTVTTTITDDDAVTGITLSADPDTLEEDQAASSVTVKATLKGSTRPSDTVVTIGTLAGTATKGTDYKATNLASITIPANTTSATGSISITPTDDKVVEGNETITISGTTTTEVGLTVTSATITLKDHNGITSEDPNDEDKADLSITGPASNVSEGGNASFMVTLSAAVASEVTVAWSAPLAADAAEGADLSVTSGTVTFAANSAVDATKTITIATTDDDLSEAAETFTVTLGAITTTLPSTLVTLKSGLSSATATITESDPITISISGPSSVDEGDATTAYTVSLSPSGVTPTEDLKVSYGTSDGTATAGSDYTAKSGTLTFANTAAGSQTFTVQTTEDTIDEGTGETISVTISSPSGGGGPAPKLSTSPTVTTTISDDDDAPSGITLSANPSSVGEDDNAIPVTVTATLKGSALPSNTVVTIGTLSGTATEDTDYEATDLASITIPANTTIGTGSITITPTDDLVVEGDETITVPGTTTTQVGLTVDSATVTLTDDDKSTTDIPGDKDSAELSISGPSANVVEGSDATFTVTLSAGVSKEVTVAWSATGNTDDYSPTSGTVTFAAGSAAGATQDVTITATDDALSEAAENFTVTLGTITSTLSSQVSLKNGASSATATIAASDPITISISGPTSVDEGDATTDYTVSLSPSGVTPTSDLTVSYNTSDGTATAGTDYTTKSGTLTFTNTAAGSQTFTVQTTEDTIDEGTGETFTVAISSPSGGGGPAPSLGTSKSVTTTITDDDDAPSGITLSADPSSVGEDDEVKSITVTATLNGSTLPSNTVVTIGTLSGTATKDTDYTATSLTTITITANTTSGTGTITITPTDDDVVEGDETITIPGTTTTQVGLTVDSATVTLTDDDGSTTDIPGDKDSAELSISGPSANVQEGSDATFTVTLSKAVSKAVTVAWSAPLAADAAEGADLSATSGTVTFASGSAAGATQDITITATDDSLSEEGESFTVTLGTITTTLPSSQLSLKSGSSSATATIAESDPITISISGPSSVDEGDATTNYTVSLTPSGVTPTADLTVSYATSDGTATAGTDYTAKSGTLTFTNTAAGSQTFTVQTTADTIDEGTGETFKVTISSPSGGGGPSSSLGTSKSVTTTITDDDDAPSGITLSADPSSVGEDDEATSITVTATLDGGTTRTSSTVVTIGTLSGTAVKDTDYKATALASITIPANTTSATGTLTITPADDTVVEGNETITIPGTTTTQVGLTVDPATVTLTDDDKSTTDIPGDKDSAELSITGPASEVSEGSNAVFTVTLSEAVAKAVTVAWSAPLGTDAAEGADLSTTSGTVTFAAGSAAGATQDITITATDDALSEAAESFTVTLGTITSTLSSQVSLKNGASSAQATIAASDPITISISGPTSVDEGDATTDYTVSLSPSGVTPTSGLTVSYNTSDGTAAGTDYTAVSGTLTFTETAAGSQTFTVQTTEDTIDEPDETFAVAISSPSGGGGPAPSLGTSKSVTTTITDDDDAPSGITLSADPSSVGEDDAATSITVTATLNGSTLPSNTVVKIGTLGGTATEDTDYAVTNLASITIPANTKSATVTLTITPTDDTVVEGDETITIPGTTTTQVGLTVDSATVTLTDDDKSTTDIPGDKDSTELSISGPSANVEEGADATFTVTLSEAVSKAVTVAWSAPLAADAAEGADLSATSGTVTFAAGSAAGSTQDITITATDDDLSETAESFTVTLGAITSTLSSQVSLKSGSSSATATIGESDPITISISGPTSVDEGDATTDYTVSLSPFGVTPTSDLTVSYATADGTAAAVTDYTAKSGTLTFTNTAAGSQTFTVQTTEDTIDEGTGETFTVAISSPSGGGGPAPSLGTSKLVTTTISDDDDAPSGITLSADPSRVGEDEEATSITVTATLDGDTTRTSATVVTIGTLLGTAVKGTDYAATNLASITIPANTTSAMGTLTITPTDDTVVEGNETITVPGTTTVSLAVTSATITLTDDDKSTTSIPADKDWAELSISGPSANVEEGADATFTVTLSEAVSKAVTVAWSAPLGTDAADGADLSATSGTVTFAAGSAAGSTQDITITASDDDLSETAESFTVTLGTITSTLSSQVSLNSDSSSATATIAESDPITISIAGPSSVNEGDATANYTVSLSPSGVTPTSDLAVSYATADGTAAAGTDYTAKSGTLTFTNTAAGSQTFTVQTTEDTIDEGTGETFAVAISSPSGGGGPSPKLSTSPTVTTTITDDDDAPTGITLGVNPSSVGEDDDATSVTVTATLDGGTTRTSATVVTIGTLSGTATEDTDYEATNLASITIPANTTSATGTLTITPTDDTVVEGNETITIPGTTTTQVGLTVDSATVTLTDDDKSTTDIPGDKDSAELSISGPSTNVVEGSDATFTVTLSEAVSKAVTVAWSAPLAADAAEGADLSATSGTVTFAADSAAGATKSITITASDDDLSETAESFTVTLGAITSTLSSQVSLKSGSSSASATIAASDPITISISGPTSVDEGDATSSYTVFLSPSGVTPTSDLTVSYATANGTATAGTDYTAKSGTLTFKNTAAGSQTFTVQTTEDTLDEGTGETFTVAISSPLGGGGPAPKLSTSPTITTTITDDDDAPTGITLSASPSTLGEDDDATSITVTATLNGSTLPSNTLVTIGTLSGTATEDTDYEATDLASITIPANTTSGTGSITITPTDDLIVEGDETITVPGTTTVSGLTVSSATITLTDDDKSTTSNPGDEDSAELRISGPSANVQEGSDATFTVTLSKAVSKEVTVAWSAPLGTDSAEGADLSATSGTVTFAANSAAGATQDIDITLTDDALSETSESFTVTLGTITSTLSSQISLKNGASSAQATIAASDPITITISGPTSVDEGDATTDYTVSLSPSGVTPTADLTVSYGTSDGTATAGTDYTAKSGTLTFTNTAAASQTFAVQTTADTIDEGTGETLKVSISSPSGGGGPSSSLGTSKSVTTTITDDDDAPSGITLSADPSSVGEDDEATSITVTATLDGDTTRTSATVVTIGTLLGTAVKGTDYAATNLASITIPANTTSAMGTLTITPTDDTVVEGDETIAIPGATTTQVGLSVTSATVTLTDDDKSTTTIPGDKDSAELSIAGPASEVAEGANAVFTVTLSEAISKAVTVAWSAPLGTDAAEGSDLSATSGTVTFAAGSAAGATQDVTITATDDDLSETAEGFTVTLGSITSSLSSQVSLKSGSSSATATIAASDPITISISGPSSVDEGDATANYTVSLTPSGVTPTADLTVFYATSDGTATAGTDYTAKSGTLTFSQTAAGSQTFTVQTTEDTIDEGTGETFAVAISSPSGGGGPSPSLGISKSVTTTISDDDDAPSGITLSADPISVGEDDEATPVTVTATLDGGTTRTSATVVKIGALSGTATEDTDYEATDLASITIPANTKSATGTLTITPTDDNVVEGDETITVSGTTTVSLNVSSATITLTDGDKSTTTPGDNDSAVLSISGPASNVSEGSDATFTVTLSKAVDAEVQVAWSAPLGTDAAEGADLSATSGTVTFAANSAAGATQDITVTAADDDLSETAEGFTVTLGTITSTLSSQVSLKTGSSSASATIAASDPITVNITGPSSVYEGDATSDYTVSLSPSGVTPTADLTVFYASADGTATAGTDYKWVAGMLTFTETAAGSQTFTVQTTEDILAESEKDFTVTISNPTGGGGQAPTLGTSSVTTTIKNDDATDDPPDDTANLITNVNVRLSVAPNSVNENAGTKDFTVTATHNAGTTRTEDITIGLTLGGTADSSDYTAPAQASVTIPANQSSGSGTLTLTFKDDSLAEGDETIIVGGSSGSLTIASALITVHDNEATYLSISGPAADVQEGANASFTVTLSETVAADVTVAWSAATGTAEAADLGTTTSGSVTFPANSAAGATQTITVAVTDDDLSEGSEKFSVALGADTGDQAANVWVKSTAASAEATIAESDPITVNINGPSSVDEGDATTAYTVSLSPSGVTPTSDLTVTYATSNGTAAAGSDYSSASGTLTFTQTAAGSQTFTVQTTEDSSDESDETFTVTNSSPAGGGGQSPSLGTSSVTTTITDDDDAPTGIVLSANPSSVDEGDAETSITVSAMLQGGTTLPSDTVVTIGALSGTATEDTDYSVTSSLATVTIPANTSSGSGNITIDPTGDDVVEGDETITIPGTTTVSGLGVASATVTIDEDDSAELSISGPGSNVTEGNNAVFTVTLSKAVSKEVTVAWSATAGTASSSDYTPGSGTVTFAANSAAGATQAINVTASDDNLSETSETFSVGLGAIGGDIASDISLKTGANSASATIAESDPITVNISGPSSVDEGDATTAYTVSLSPSGVTPTSDLTVTYATSNGTATAGSDYSSASGTLTFTQTAAGSQTFTVQTTEDSADEPGETFTVTISSPAGGGGQSPSLGTSSVTTTITDDDDAPTGIVLSASPSSVDEGDIETSITVTATLQGGTTLPSDTVVTISTLSGTATEDTDYSVTLSLASVTIPANTSSGSGTIKIDPTGDDVVEGDETITIPGTTTVSGLGVTSATVTIDEDDSAELSISGPGSGVSEGSNAVFTVTLSKAVSKEVTVAWSATAGTASSSDYTPGSGTVTFAANSAAGATQTISVTASDDKPF